MKRIILEWKHKEWENEFGLLKEILQKKLHHLIIDVHHIGSSSVPGVISKPIIDADIVIENKDNLAEIIKILQKLGYVYKGEQNVKDRHVFRQKHPFIPFSFSFKKWKKQHLYVCLANSLALKNHLLLKEALLESEVLRKNYSALKEQLIHQKNITKEEYSVRKTEFILNVLKQKGISSDELNQLKPINS